MAVRSDIQQQAGEIARSKAAAKECLIAADKFLKDKLFDKARQQVDKAKEIDPSNPYISAFEERIKIFEEQIRAQAPVAKPAPPSSAPAPNTPEPPKPTSATAAPAGVETRKPTPPPEPPKPPKVPQPEPLRAVPVPKPVVATPDPAGHRTISAASATPPSDELKIKMDEMSRQILELSSALLSERRTREDILKKQLEQSVRQFRDALRKTWTLGAPKEKQNAELDTVARSLNLDDEVIMSITREVKLEMYGRAVKEMLAKRKLIRSSSSTMDWLRKVYQVSMAEYLEYESKFLLDLVTDQFRGTLLLVAGTDELRRDMAPRMKSSGFAVVVATTPEEALEKIERVSPTIVITETQFPGRVVSGVMFLQLLRANPKYSYVPVLLICDEQEAVTLQSSELRDIEGVARTPVDYDELNAMINEKLAALRNAISNI